MPRRYRQFLGSKPGIVVELIDESSSPYRVRTDDGFEFSISSDDFSNYYTEEGAPAPPRWRHLITNPDDQTVNSGKMGEVMRLVRLFENDFRDPDKARAFVRDAMVAIARDPKPNPEAVRTSLQKLSWDPGILTDEHFRELRGADDAVRDLILSETCGVIPFVALLVDSNGEDPGFEFPEPDAKEKTKKAPKRPKKTASPRSVRGGTDNLQLSVSGDILTVTVDLSKEHGPSKSGKTTIVASSLGNKPIPGRNEYVGLNIYRQETKRRVTGRRNEFKNLVMAVDGDTLTLTIDLSKEFGPSKSGRTIIIASSEGNQLVYGRNEKIGLNVYRKID